MMQEYDDREELMRYGRIKALNSFDESIAASI
jgi:hypothetical protein